MGGGGAFIHLLAEQALQQTTPHFLQWCRLGRGLRSQALAPWHSGTLALALLHSGTGTSSDSGTGTDTLELALALAPVDEGELDPLAVHAGARLAVRHPHRLEAGQGGQVTGGRRVDDQVAGDR